MRNTTEKNCGNKGGYKNCVNMRRFKSFVKFLRKKGLERENDLEIQWNKENN